MPDLLQKIKTQRDRIAVFLGENEPRAILYVNLSIICGAIATLLTAGTAIGGARLSHAFDGVSQNSPTIRLLCGAAMVFSAVATTANHLYKSHDLASQIAKAKSCDAKLESLAVLVELHQITLGKGVQRFEACLSDIFFISPMDRRRGWRSKPDPAAVTGKINDPTRQQDVVSTITCSGRVNGFGPGLYLWLAVEHEGRIWPKESSIPVENEGTWARNVFEEGELDDFSLSLFAADNKGHKHVRAWLDACDQTGSYPALRRTPGLIKIDSVEVRRRREQ